jgi:hypothetical protein
MCALREKFRDFLLPALVVLMAPVPCRAELDRSFAETARHATALIECFNGGRYVGSGCAFCIDSGGIFVANNHLATTEQRSNRITLYLNPGTPSERQLLATVVKTDPGNNLAILRVERVERAGPLETVELADAASMNALKETNPLSIFGFTLGAPNARKSEVAISSCRITALRHEQNQLKLIQTDGLINPGHFGSPAINEAGEVVGVVAPLRPGLVPIKGIVQLNNLVPATRVRELLATANITLAPGLLTEPAMLMTVEEAEFKVLPNRQSIPNDAQFNEANKLVRELFEKQYADITPNGQRALGPGLLATAKTTGDDPVSRYAMLRQSIQAAAVVFDFRTAINAARELIRYYDVDPIKLKNETITQFAPKIFRPQDHALLAAHGLLLARAAVHHQAYSDARHVIPLVRHAANSSGNPVVIERVRQQLAIIETLCDEHDRLKDSFDKLAKDPADPDCNLAVGRFICLRLGNYEKGLPYLANCSDASLKTLATADLANPAAAPAQKELADLWWDLAQREDKNDFAADICKRRAAHWYQRAQPNLKGLARQLCDHRLDTLPQNVALAFDPVAAPPERLSPGADGWTVIFRSSEPIQWNTMVREPNVFAAPITLAPSNMRYLRMRKNDGDFVIIPLTYKQLGQSLSGNTCGWEGRSINVNNAFHLGIFVQAMPRPNGTVDVCPEYTGKTGYGFGNYIRQDDRQGFAWAGRTIDRTVFEISVTGAELTKREKERLLKWD